ncbi:MAG: SRPBCC family protein [Cyclobacteriaceae bacterium]
MKNLKSFLLTSAVAFILPLSAVSQKLHTITVKRVINAPAEKVWKVAAQDYGEISNWNRYLYTSEYVEGSLIGETGAQRMCDFNEKGSQWLKEEIGNLDNEKMEMKNLVVGAGKFPIDTDYSYAYTRVKDNGDNTSTLSYEYVYRTKPAFMGGMAKGKFKKMLNDLQIGVDHYVITGETVNATTGNWKAIKKKYKQEGRFKGEFSS